MRKPFQYTIIDNETKEVVFEQNFPPLLHHLQKLVEISKGVFERKQVRTAYIDTRFKAKKRLYEYLKKNGRI